MYRRGRPVIAEFDAHEPLFLRYRREQFADGRLQNTAVRFPKQSVNRGLLSEPGDVLFDETRKYEGYGVVDLRVSDIPQTIALKDNPAYRFYVEHSPNEDNYEHADICSALLGDPGLTKEPSRSVRIEFRSQLARMAGIDRIRIPATL